MASILVFILLAASIAAGIPILGDKVDPLKSDCFNLSHFNSEQF